jgi:hypothetical protein
MQRSQEIEIEAFAIFVRMRLSTTPEIPDHQKSAAVAQAHERYDRFLKRLAEKIGDSKSLLSELPAGVVLKMEDFYGC